MHAELFRGLDRLRQTLIADERCLGMFLWGSQGTESADDLSDLDVAVVAKDSDYAGFKKGLPLLCERCFGPLVGWLPEGERDGLVNYAFLFRASGELLLCDLLTISEGVYRANPTAKADRVVFDRGEFLRRLAPAAGPKRQDLSAPKLAECLHDYWTYMYLNGKYCRREDLFKILSTQEALFQRHVSLLRFLYPDHEWSGWAAKDVQRFPQECQDRLLTYFAGARMHTIGELLRQEMDFFSRDAQETCRKNGVEYPGELESRVREHLVQMKLAGISGIRE